MVEVRRHLQWRTYAGVPALGRVQDFDVRVSGREDLALLYDLPRIALLEVAGQLAFPFSES